MRKAILKRILVLTSAVAPLHLHPYKPLRTGRSFNLQASTMPLLTRAADAADGTRYIAGYLASAPAATLATGGYGLVAAILWLHYVRNGRKYLLTICIGATGMTIGYGIRIYTHWEPDSIPIFSAMTLFILVSVSPAEFEHRWRQ